MFKMFVDLVGSGVDIVRCAQCGGDMKEFWMMFDHAKCLHG